MKKRQSRFVFVEYKPGGDVEIATHSMQLNGHLLEMTKIVLHDFGILFDALAAKKAAFPVKLLRRFKEELYAFAITSDPGTTMQVAPLGDQRIDENTLALSIGLAQTGVYGLARLVDGDAWYENIVLHNLTYSADELLQYTYPELNKQNSGKLPICMYLNNSDIDYPEIITDGFDYSSIVNGKSIERIRRQTEVYDSALELWEGEKHSFNKAIRLLGGLPENKVSADDYEIILNEIYQNKEPVLSTLAPADRSNLRKVIRIYDWLKWGKK